MIELHSTAVQYGARLSPGWVLLLLLLLGVQPMLNYLTVRYSSWKQFRMTLAASLRNITEMLHVHPHPRHA